MTAERDSMTLNEVSVPALGVEERSDEVRAGLAPELRNRRLWPSRGAAPVHRRVSAADSGGGGSLHTARRGGPPASPRGVVQLASDGLAPRRKGSLRELAAEARRETGRTQPLRMRRCARSRRKWLAWSTSCTPRTRSWTCREKLPGCWDRTSNTERALDGGPTACGAGRHGAGLPSTGRVTGDLLPSSEVNSRAPAAPSNARPGAV